MNTNNIWMFGSTYFLYIALALSFNFFVPSSSACTTFSLPNHDKLVVGKSYDWYAGQGVGMVSQRGVAKTALDIKGDFTRPASWVSKFGSLTFTQFGIDLPLGGVNERGLVVEIMWMNSSKYPKQQTLPQVNELQWIQYILDLASSVDEAIELAEKIQVEKFFAPVHYMVCDLKKNCASFEYIDSELVITRQSVKTLTNNPYKDSFSHLSKFETFGGQQVDPQDLSLQRRFVRASFESRKPLKSYDTESTSNAAFRVLDLVYSNIPAKNFASRWQLVYQPEETRVDFRIPLTQEVFSIDTSLFDYDCRSSDPIVFDLRGDVLEGVEKWKFVDYDRVIHHFLIFEAGNRSIGSPFSADMSKRVDKELHSRVCVK